MLYIIVIRESPVYAELFIADSYIPQCLTMPTDLHQVLQVPTDLQVASTAHADPTSTDLQVYSYRYALLVLSSCRLHLMDKKSLVTVGKKLGLVDDRKVIYVCQSDHSCSPIMLTTGM